MRGKKTPIIAERVPAGGRRKAARKKGKDLLSRTGGGCIIQNEKKEKWSTLDSESETKLHDRRVGRKAT